METKNWCFVFAYECEPDERKNSGKVFLAFLHTFVKASNEETAYLLGQRWLEREHPEEMKQGYNNYVIELG